MQKDDHRLKEEIKELMNKQLNGVADIINSVKVKNAAASRPSNPQTFSSNFCRPSYSMLPSGNTIRYGYQPYVKQNYQTKSNSYNPSNFSRPRSDFTYCRTQAHVSNLSKTSNISAPNMTNPSKCSITKLPPSPKKWVADGIKGSCSNTTSSHIAATASQQILQNHKSEELSSGVSVLLPTNRTSSKMLIVNSTSTAMALNPGTNTAFKENVKASETSNVIVAVPNANNNKEQLKQSSRQIVKTAYKVINEKTVKESIGSKTQNIVPAIGHERTSVKNRVLIRKTPPSSKKVVKTKYKIVNRKRSTSFSGTPFKKGSVKKGKICNVSKPTLKTSLNHTSATRSKINSISEKVSSLNNSFQALNEESSLGQKIGVRNFDFEASKNNFDLTDLEPEDILSLNPVEILKLNAMVSSKQTIVKKPNYRFESKMTKSRNVWCKPKFHLPSSSHTLLNGPQKHISFAKNAARRKKMNMLHLQNKKRFQNPSIMAIGGSNYHVTRMKILKTSTKKTNSKVAMTKKTSVKSEDPVSIVIIVKGMRFSMDPSGSTLTRLPSDENEKTTPFQRINVMNRTYVRKTADVYTEETPGNRIHANKVLNRIIYKPNDMKKSSSKTTYCMFFNRYGKCNNQDKCPYLHDPSKIAVCTRFLKGTCKAEKCCFSHERNPGKMAICSFFLQGTCTVDDCPYRHESLAPDAELCQAFVKGYCPLADKCKMAHILVCPQHFNGNCPKGNSCPYPHPIHKVKKNEEVVKENSEDFSLKPMIEDTPNNEPSASKQEEEELRYFSSSHPISLTSQETSEESEDAGASALKQACTWSSEAKTVQVLPGFIPLSFQGTDSLM